MIRPIKKCNSKHNNKACELSLGHKKQHRNGNLYWPNSEEMNSQQICNGKKCGDLLVGWSSSKKFDPFLLEWIVTSEGISWQLIDTRKKSCCVQGNVDSSGMLSMITEYLPCEFHVDDCNSFIDVLNFLSYQLGEKVRGGK